MLCASENSKENIAELPEWIDGHSAQFYYIFPGKVSLSLLFFFFFFLGGNHLKKKVCLLCVCVCCFIFLLSKFGALTPHRSYQRR